MGPPPLPSSDISDSISMSDTRTVQSSRSRSRSHSIHPLAAEMDRLDQEERQLAEEIALYEKRERIAAPRARREQLISGQN
jgi:cell division protein FtsB